MPHWTVFAAVNGDGLKLLLRGAGDGGALTFTAQTRIWSLGSATHLTLSASRSFIREPLVPEAATSREVLAGDWRGEQPTLLLAAPRVDQALLSSYGQLAWPGEQHEDPWDANENPYTPHILEEDLMTALNASLLRDFDGGAVSPAPLRAWLSEAQQALETQQDALRRRRRLGSPDQPDEFPAATPLSAAAFAALDWRPSHSGSNLPGLHLRVPVGYSAGTGREAHAALHSYAQAWGSREGSLRKDAPLPTQLAVTSALATTLMAYAEADLTGDGAECEAPRTWLSLLRELDAGTLTFPGRPRAAL